MSPIIEQVIRQLSNFWSISDDDINMIIKYENEVLNRCEYCFQRVDNKYFRLGVNLTHSGQWLSFLYYFSNTLSHNGKTALADKFYYLNKVMHSVDIYHAVNLPDVFFLEHPVGSVFGRAEYGTNFFAMQNCTVGGNRDRKTGELFYPVIGDNVKMYSGSKIIGKSKIGNNVTLAANTYVKDIEIPDGATVFGQSPNLVIKFLK
ncbi:LbetaH domain-containing protein [Bacteroides congonensis]|uniref:transferase n=1 Tax=Bacteroides congonensis TaxID=1871006 RepID=UPI001899D1F8|nr:transferase [Bacteroides congonensis]